MNYSNGKGRQKASQELILDSLTVPDIQHTVLGEHHTLAFQSVGNPALLTLLLWEPWDLPDLKHHYVVVNKLAEIMGN